MVPAAVRHAFATVWDHLVVEDPLRAADAAFCFGSRDRRVAPVAAALHRRGLAPRVLVTGGADPSLGVAEADRMARALRAGGVAADRIVVERAARHTGENVALGVAALRAVAPARRLLLVSWPLAARRCRATFGARHPEVEVVSVPALPAAGVRWGPTWRRVRLALGEIDRLERYGASGDVAVVPVPRPVRDAVAELRAGLGSADDAALDEVEAPGARAEPEQAALALVEG